MNTPIFVNSTDGIRNSKSHDFTISFIVLRVLDKNRDYYASLDSLSMTYSWYNVDTIYNNNTLKYSHDGGTTWTSIVFPSGNYTYADLNNINQQSLS